MAVSSPLYLLNCLAWLACESKPSWGRPPACRPEGDGALIYVHKEKELDDVEKRYPAEHYVMVDDKLRILTAMKNIWRDRLTTVFPRQGHYALDAKAVATYPPADLTVGRIGELVNYDLSSFTGSKRE